MNKIYRYNGVVLLIVSSMAYATNRYIPVEIEQDQAVILTVTQDEVWNTIPTNDKQTAEEEDSDSKKKKNAQLGTSVIEFSEEDIALDQATEEELPTALDSTPTLFNDSLLTLCVGEEATYTITTAESRVLVDFDDGSGTILLNRREGINIFFKKPGNYYVVMTPMSASGQLLEYQRKAVYTTVYRCYLPVNHNLKNAE